jgi:hypothetical protein
VRTRGEGQSTRSLEELIADVRAAREAAGVRDGD